jgi:L-asparaginase
MATIIRDVYEDYDGFVVLHGTDTMAYTTSALAFIIDDLTKPVVVTGSQLPISYRRTDGVQNLVSAIYIAGYKAVDLPCIPEVVLCFADRILRGCRATKVSTEDWAGFESPNFPPLGTIGGHIKINTSLLAPPGAKRRTLPICEELAGKEMDNAVLDVGLFPGFTASQLDALLGLPQVKGVVLRTFGAGNAPGDAEFLSVLERSINRADREPCVVVNATQCLKGTVEMGQYVAGSGLLEQGVISGLDMTKEAALAKLYWTIATQIGERITTQMQINQRGEQSENLFDLRYGAAGTKDEPVPRFVQTKSPDYRLDRDRVSRTVVRLSGVGFVGVEEGEKVTIRIFMNKGSANAETPRDDPNFIAEVCATWEGQPLTLIQDVTREAIQAMGRSDILLSVVPLGGVRIWFKGLCLALFSRAAF